MAHELLLVPPPHPEPEKAARLQGRITPGDWMVGDTEADQRAAEQLGLPCLVLHRGFRSRRYWQQHEVESFGSLPQVFAAMTDQTKEE